MCAGYYKFDNKECRNQTSVHDDIAIKDTYLEAAGTGDRIMNLSHLNMTGGSITPSSYQRVLTQDFNLTYSTLRNTSINSQYAQGNTTLDHNKFDNSQFYSQSDGTDTEAWGEPYEPSATLTVTNNTFENGNSRVYVGNHKFNTITINNNQFKNNSQGVHIQPDNILRYGKLYTKNPADVEIKNNTFTKDRKGIYIQAGKFNVTGNNFIESPGIRYNGVAYSGSRYEQYQKGFFDFKINNNYFIKQKGLNGSSVNTYAIENISAVEDNLELQNNTFCSKDRVALRLSTDKSARMTAGNNYWNTTNKTSIQRNMVFDHLVDLDVNRTISYGMYNQDRNPNLSSALELACAAEAEGSEPEDAPACTLGGMILPGTPALDPATCSVYNIIEDVQIPKGVILRANPGVKIEGKYKNIKVEGGLDFVGSKDSKIVINNTYIQPAGDPDNPTFIMNLSHLNMTGGSITPSSYQRVLTQDFNLTYSTLRNTSINSQYAQGNTTLDHNKFDNSQFYSQSDGTDTEAWGEPYEPSATLTVTNNTFENGNSRVYVGNHKFNTITINNNQFKNNSQGVHIQPDNILRYGKLYTKNPADVEIKNNTFTKDRKGIYIQAGKFNVTGNNFIESPGIRYNGVAYSGSRYEQYQKGFFDFKINNNTFCRQKGQDGNQYNEYAIFNISKLPSEDPAAIVKNNFCSADKFAVRIGTTPNDTSGMIAKNNFWNTGNHFTIDSKMVYDRADDINIYGFIPYVPFLSAPYGESSGVSPKVSQTLPQCTVVSSNQAGSICNQVCEGISPGDDEPEPEPVDLNVEMLLTFPPPLIIPRDRPKGDDAILQASFNISIGHQWEGHLKKYKLNKDGSIGNLEWDAGKLLNDNKQASNRNIFTVGDGLTVFGHNNFKESNVDKLKPILYGDGHINIDVEDAKKLINFVRGVDVFDEVENKAERWKLGDIYHAELAVMGMPTAKITDNPDKKHTDAGYRFSNKYATFSKSYQDRTKVVFAGANDGMLHAFNLDTGEELWAFIPPMITSKLKDMVSAKPNKSMSIFAVDSTPVVKDVFLSGKWRTIVMGGLGMGGHGYYALDVTDPGSPEHLFSFSYDPDTKQGNTWTGRNGTKSITDNFDNLGEAWSKPLILRVPIGGSSRWVAVIGGGFNGGNVREYGSVIYVLDLEDSGRVIKKIDVSDLSGNKIFNSVPTSLTAITPDSSDKANYTGAMVYFADLEGKLWKLNLTNQGVPYSMKQVFDVEADNLNGRLSYHSVTPTMGSDNKLRMFYGTGDQQKLMSGSLQIDNRFLGLKEQKFPSEDASPTFKEDSLLDTTGDTSLCSDENDQGWKIKLKPGEKVTSKAMVSYGTVFFSRYEPLTTDQCALGKTSITGVDYQCGSEKFTVDLGTGISTVPTLYRGKLYIGISGDAINKFTPPEGWIKKDNLLMGEPGDLSTWQGVKTKSWREGF